MLILGALALLQVSFLPGYLFLYYTNFRRGFFNTLLLSFGLSLTINYAWVAILTSMHVYTRNYVFGVFTAEILLLLWSLRFLLYKQWFVSLEYLWPNLQKKFKLSYSTYLKQPKMMIYSQIIALFFAFYLIYYYLHLDPSIKSIFSIWDAVVSWNLWAIDWYQNIFIRYEYPQLVPINISLTYQFIGNSTIQLFGRAIFFLFPIAMLLCLWECAKRQKKNGYYWAIPFLVISLLALYNSAIYGGAMAVSGEADIPVACMVLLGFYALISANAYTLPNDITKSVLISALIFSGAVVTKQAGIYFVLIFPILLYTFVLKKINYPEKPRLMFGAILLILAYLSHYIYFFIDLSVFHPNNSITKFLYTGLGYTSVVKPTLAHKAHFGAMQLWNTLNSSNIPVHHRSILAGFIKIINLLSRLFPWYATLLLIIGGCFNAYVRKLIFLIILPTFLIWLFFVSYDLRNIAVTLPFLSIALGISFELTLPFLKLIFLKLFFFIFTFLKFIFLKLIRTNVFTITLVSLILVIIVGLYLNFKYNDERLMKAQIERQKQIGDPRINQKLYAYFAVHPLNGLIMTNYALLPYLPEFQGHFLYNHFNSTSNFESIINTDKPSYILILQIHSAVFESTLPGENYVLKNDGNKFQVIFNENGYLFAKSKLN